VSGIEDDQVVGCRANFVVILSPAARVTENGRFVKRDDAESTSDAPDNHRAVWAAQDCGNQRSPPTNACTNPHIVDGGSLHLIFGHLECGHP
jgi:hypothetical protein